MCWLVQQIGLPSSYGKVFSMLVALGGWMYSKIDDIRVDLSYISDRILAGRVRKYQNRGHVFFKNRCIFFLFYHLSHI